MANALQQMGFAVTPLLNADLRRMRDAIETFRKQLRPGVVGLFYFAGHGLQVNGENYLVPIGARIARDQDVEFETVDVRRILGAMEGADNGVNIIVLDACRNNPFARSLRSSQRGLAVTQAITGSLIAYATAPGSTAADGSGRNGVYTSHLLQNMSLPGLPIEQVFKNVRLGVMKETANKQTPWESSSLTGHVTFIPAAENPAPGPISQPQGTQVAVGIYPQQPAPKTLRNSIGMELMLIQAGTFQMGSNDGEPNEKPVHTVHLSRPFYLGKYEVTQAQWEAVMDNNPSEYQGRPGSLTGALYKSNPNRPVETVSWNDVQEFIRQLNARESGARYRLPTEAEWEYAARAGSTTAYSFGDDWRQFGQYGWYIDNTDGAPAPVGQLRPNAWGLYDMYGNVWEWVQDWEGSYPSSSVTDPTGSPSGSARVMRGGSSRVDEPHARSSTRGGLAPSDSSDYLGFRLLREVP